MRYLIAALILFASCAPSKKITKMDYPVPFRFELIDTVAGSKNDLYVKAYEWMAKTFVSAKSVIQMQDKEAGKIIGRAVFSSAKGTTNYILAIDVKDGKYMASIEQFSHEGLTYISQYGSGVYRSYGNLQAEKITYKSSNGVDIVDKNYYAVKNSVMISCQTLLDDLKEAMHKPPKDF